MKMKIHVALASLALLILIPMCDGKPVAASWSEEEDSGSYSVSEINSLVSSSNDYTTVDATTDRITAMGMASRKATGSTDGTTFPISTDAVRGMFSTERLVTGKEEIRNPFACASCCRLF